MSSFPPPPGGPPAGAPTPPPWQTPSPAPGGFSTPAPSPAFGAPGGPGGGAPGGPAGPTSPGPGSNGPVSGGPPPKSGGKRAGIIAAVVVVAAIAGGGTFLLTRNDDKKKISDSETTVESVDETEPTDTEAPDTTVPETATPTTAAAATTLPEPTTTSSTSTTVAESTTTTSTFVVPAGAIDLGHNLYLPVPTGWSQTTSDPGSKVVFITDGTNTLAVQVLERTPGEAPTQVVQEYANTFGTTFEDVSYGQTDYIKRLEGDGTGIPVDEYSTYYITYDGTDPDGVGINGIVNNYIRGDGLNMIYDLYGPDGGTGYPDDSSAELLASMRLAPQLTTPLTLTPSASFRIATNYPNIDVDGLVGFTPAPGFHPVYAGNGRGFASNDVEDFDVVKLTGQASAQAAIATAQSLLGATYTGVTFGDPSAESTDADGIIQVGVGWVGTYIAGNPSAGSIDIFFDPTTSNAFSITSSWFTGADASEPAAPQSAFMFRSIYNAFTHIN